MAPPIRWSFRRSEMRLAFGLAQALRQELKPETENVQLRAIADFLGRTSASDGDPSVRVDQVRAAVRRLAEAFAALAPERAPGPPAAGDCEPAAVVVLGGGCNNGCAACAQLDFPLDDGKPEVLLRIEEAREEDLALLLAGREPTMHPGFLDIVAAASGPDRRPVGVVTNARRFAVPGFAWAAVRQGLSAASVKLFAADAKTADAITRVSGSHAQALAGINALAHAGEVALELRVPLEARNLARLGDYVPLAQSIGIRQVRLEAALDALGLDRLEEATAAVQLLAQRAAAEGMALDASPLSDATRGFAWLPCSPGDGEGGRDPGPRLPRTFRGSSS